MGKIIGIDLGTTNSLVAVFEAGGPRVIADPAGRALLPSVVRYEGPRTIVGWEAKEHAAEFPLTTVSSVKRRTCVSDAFCCAGIAWAP